MMSLPVPPMTVSLPAPPPSESSSADAAGKRRQQVAAEDDVVARPAEHRVVARAAVERVLAVAGRPATVSSRSPPKIDVVAGPADDLVVGAVARQVVPERGAGQVLEWPWIVTVCASPSIVLTTCGVSVRPETEVMPENARE